MTTYTTAQLVAAAASATATSGQTAVVTITSTFPVELPPGLTIDATTLAAIEANACAGRTGCTVALSSTRRRRLARGVAGVGADDEEKEAADALEESGLAAAGLDAAGNPVRAVPGRAPARSLGTVRGVSVARDVGEEGSYEALLRAARPTAASIAADRRRLSGHDKLLLSYQPCVDGVIVDSNLGGGGAAAIAALTAVTGRDPVEFTEGEPTTAVASKVTVIPSGSAPDALSSLDLQPSAGSVMSSIASSLPAIPQRFFASSLIPCALTRSSSPSSS